MGARRRSREAGLQLLYQLEAHVQSLHARDQAPASLAGGDDAIDRLTDAFFENFEAQDKVRRYAEDLVRGVVGAHERIDALISAHSPNWRLERMAMVDRNVLRLATYELFAGDVPRKVILDEAVEIARRFGSEKSSAFVNGVASAVAKAIESAIDDPVVSEDGTPETNGEPADGQA